MRLARTTVRKYAEAESFPARPAYGPRPGILDPYVPYLEQRLTEGCENALALWRELRERGFAGTSRQVHCFVAERRTKPVKAGRPAGTLSSLSPMKPSSRCPRRASLRGSSFSPSRPWTGPRQPAWPTSSRTRRRGPWLGWRAASRPWCARAA